MVSVRRNVCISFALVDVRREPRRSTEPDEARARQGFAFGPLTREIWGVCGAQARSDDLSSHGTSAARRAGRSGVKPLHPESDSDPTLAHR